MDVAEFFRASRFDDNTHLGLGDIRLTLHYQQCIEAEIARLTAELAAAKNELRSKDENYTPLLDNYAANCQRLSDELAASQGAYEALSESYRVAAEELAASQERERVTLDELSEAKAMLDYHVYKPVGADDATQKLGQHLAGMCNDDQWPSVERLLNGVRERERVLREAVVAALAVAIGCKGRIALTFFHVDKIRAALGEDGGNG